MRVDDRDTGAGIPVLSLIDGEIKVVGTATDVDGCAEAMAAFARAWGTGLRAAVGTADAGARAVSEALAAALVDADEIVEVVHYRIGPSVGVHTGPGTSGAFFWPATT
jgi:fatty acid-binding protein DegV